MVEEEVAMEKRNNRGDCQKMRRTPRKASANSCFTSTVIDCIFRRYIVTVGRLICNLHRKVNISDNRDLCTFRILLLLLSTSHNVMYYNDDNVVWPRFLKFLRYYISYMNGERGIPHHYKYFALFRIIYQRELCSFINLYYILSFCTLEN